MEKRHNIRYKYNICYVIILTVYIFKGHVYLKEKKRHTGIHSHAINNFLKVVRFQVTFIFFFLLFLYFSTNYYTYIVITIFIK